MRRKMQMRLAAAAGVALVLAWGLVAAGQSDAGDYSFEAGLLLVIGDVPDPFRYDGEKVRELEGSASLKVDPLTNTGLLVDIISTAEESGPIVVSEKRSLEGVIRVVMDRFRGSELCMSGGITEQLLLHGDTGVMSAAMPEMFAHLVGWGCWTSTWTASLSTTISPVTSCSQIPCGGMNRWDTRSSARATALSTVPTSK
jgi:hypothetical protein